MCVNSIEEAILNTDFNKEWEKHRELLGTVFVNFKNPEVVKTFDDSKADCKGIYVLYDAVTEKLKNLYCGVSEKPTSTCRGRILSHCRSIENALGLPKTSSESTGKNAVEYYKDRDTATLAVWFMDLEKFKIPGFKLLFEENMIPILEGSFNRENKKKEST